jgi:3-oxoacyl-[acyl-carrier-protein] synthase II
LNITGWSAVSPYGLGRAAFAEGMLARRRTAVALDPGQWPVPDAHACLVPQFDPRTALGRKGTRTMNRVTGLAVAAVGHLAGDSDGQTSSGPTAFHSTPRSARHHPTLDPSFDPALNLASPVGDTALVLGTTTGSVQSMMDFTRASLTGERPFDVEPAAIPNSVLNCAAAQCAIWHRIQGPNTTLACGRPSGLLALAYARRLLLGGRATAVLCGGAEEYSPARSWLAHHSRGGSPALLGEGAAILRVELTDGPGTLASVLAVESRVRLCDTIPGAPTPATAHAAHAAHSAHVAHSGSAHPRSTHSSSPPPRLTPPIPAEVNLAAVVAATVRRALDRAGVSPRNVWAAVPSGLSEGERAALDGLVEPAALDRVPPTAELLGDTGAASAAFQLAATLAAGQDAPGQVAVITSVDVDGVVAAAVLRLGPSVSWAGV